MHRENGEAMLGHADLIAFVPTRDPRRSRRFYEQTLGLEFVSEDPFALVFSAHGVMLRIVNVSNVKDFSPAPFTILGWRVSSAESTVRGLREKGIEFERFPGMDQNALGIWHSPGGAQVAWFKDPDGNVLSVTEI
jgi:catechol 2,3-dioxygenase-like lactoylglutathione lyase family enzyme